jgi:PGDYG protein
MRTLRDIELRTDPAARAYVKHEVVTVSFARAPGELMSLEGPNRYGVGDAIVTGSTHDRWVVSRARFDPRYEAVPPTNTGSDGQYQTRPVLVLAKQMNIAFSIERSAGGDVLHGTPGDWLMQYSPGDYGIVKQSRFAQVYRPAHTG